MRKLTYDLSFTRYETLCEAITHDTKIIARVVIEARANEVSHFELFITNCDEYLKTEQYKTSSEMFDALNTWLKGENAEMIASCFGDDSLSEFI